MYFSRQYKKIAFDIHPINLYFHTKIKASSLYYFEVIIRLDSIDYSNVFVSRDTADF